MNTNEMILRELIHIRCLIEGLYLDSKEATVDNVSLNNIQERCIDETHEYLDSRTQQGEPTE